MKTVVIQCDTKGEIILTLAEKVNGLVLVLIDDKKVPIAKYEFNINKLEGIDKIVYSANNVRMRFVGITPSMKSELCPINE